MGEQAGQCLYQVPLDCSGITGNANSGCGATFGGAIARFDGVLFLGRSVLDRVVQEVEEDLPLKTLVSFLSKLDGLVPTVHCF